MDIDIPAEFTKAAQIMGYQNQLRSRLISDFEILDFLWNLEYFRFSCYKNYRSLTDCLGIQPDIRLKEVTADIFREIKFHFTNYAGSVCAARDFLFQCKSSYELDDDLRKKIDGITLGF